MKESPAHANAVLALADGSLWQGQRLGVPGHRSAEIVFNTAMFGYQEILTDPSYTDQIVVFTCPHIGNVGVNPADTESDAVAVAGLVVNRRPTSPSNWVAESSFEQYLRTHRQIAICQIDTRALTAHLRNAGVMGACLYTTESALTDKDLSQATHLARTEAPDLSLVCLATQVSTKRIYDLDDTPLASKRPAHQSPRTHIVVYDFGVKHSILRILSDLGCKVSVVPATTSVEQLLALKPDGVVLSNGPGDPRACPALVEIIAELIEQDLPILGICLGHQLLALAVGAEIFKMKFGHHGANHPVIDLRSQRVFISSQNHNYAVEASTLPATATQTHRSLFDDSLQGFQLNPKPIFGFQGHPEANPGPRELASLFTDFLAAVRS